MWPPPKIVRAGESPYAAGVSHTGESLAAGESIDKLLKQCSMEMAVIDRIPISISLVSTISDMANL